MHRIEIRIGGFGGQGIILSGYIMGKAATIYEKKNAVLNQSYGPEARGGACSAEVVISGTEIDYPYVSIPEILVLMSQEAYSTYGSDISENGLMIIDEDLVEIGAEGMKKIQKKNIKLLSIPTTRLAEGLGKKIVANIVMLGFFTAATNAVGYEAMKSAILSSVPKGTEDLNMKAFNSGYNFKKTEKN